MKQLSITISRNVIAGIALLLTTAVLPVAQAASGTFTGSTDATWTNTLNWSSGTVPGLADTATFNSAANGNTTIDLSAIASAVTAIWFDTASAAAFTIGSGVANSQTLTLGNAANAGTLSMTATVANNQTFNSAITLGNSGTTASYNIANLASAQILTFNGNIAGGSTGTAGTKTLNIGATGTITINGSISAGGATALNLTKTGGGVLNLNGATTLGNLSIGLNATSGTVAVGSGVTVSVGTGAGSALYVGANFGGSNPVGIGTLDLTSAQGFIANVGTFGVGYSTGPTSATGTSTGTFTLGGAGTITADNFYVGVGQSSGASGNFKTDGKFVLATGATLTLSGTSSAGANLYVGWSFGGSNASAQFGTMDLSSGAANLTLSRLWVSRSSNSVGGNGTLTLSSSYSNHLVVSGAGSVVTIGFSTGSAAGTGTVTLRNLDATSAITSTDNSTAILLGANNAGAKGILTLSGGTLTITTTGSAIAKGTGAGTLTLNNFTLIAGASNATSGKWITGLTAATLTGAVTFDSGTFTISSDQIFTGAGSLTKAGTGTLTLSGANTFTGGTAIGGGTLSISTLVNGAASNLGSASASTGTLTLGGGVLQYTGSSATMARPWRLTDGTGSGIDVTVAANTLTISTAAPSSTGSLTKSGSGTLVLTGANGYSGDTTILAGTVAAGADNALGSGQVTLSGGILAFGGNWTLPNPVNLSSSGTIDTGASSGTLGGTITGGTALTKIGSGDLNLTGNNAYTGDTIISSGNLRVNNGSAIPDTGRVVLSAVSAALFTLTASETIGSLEGGMNTPGNGIDLGGNTLTTGGNNLDTTFAGILAESGGGTITKAGTGTWTLTGDSTGFTWTMDVAAGKVINNGTFGASATVNVTGGTLGGTGVVGAVTVSPAGHLSPGNSAGVITMGSLDLSGGVTNGALQFELDLPGSSSDRIDVSGALNIGNGLLGFTNFQFTALSGLTNDVYTLITSGGLTVGTSLNSSDLSGVVGVDWIGTLSIDDNNLYLTLVAIPEPSTWVLVGVALLPLMLRRRRKS